MPTGYVEAVDSIYALFESKWNDGKVEELLGYVPDILWRNVELDSKPSSDKFWVRVSQQTINDGQSSFANNFGFRRFTTYGLVFVQLFAPKSNPRANELAQQLAAFIRDIFRGKTEDECVWFRNSKIKELPEERDTYRFNVIAEYEYDEIA